MPKTRKGDRPEVEIVNSDYQPSAVELDADMPVEASFEEAVDALTQPVNIRYVDQPRKGT